MNTHLSGYGLYPILDYDYCRKNSIDEMQLVSLWLKFPNEIPMIQIRNKSQNRVEVEKSIRCLKNEFPEVRWILNDFWEMAEFFDLFGFHIGKEDYQRCSVQEKKSLAKSKLFKGTSSHSLKDLETLDADIWNYTGFGPMFPTQSKDTPHSVLGTQILKSAVHISKVPLVPIGGIDASNIRQVWEKGRFFPAGISVFSSDEFLKEIIIVCREFKNLDAKVD